MQRWMLTAAVAACLFGAGCGESDDEAKILGPKHAGWKQPQCGKCHKLPEEDHTAKVADRCAACHGGNGACDPNGAGSKKKTHTAQDSCIGCHGITHTFNATYDCAACHFAAAGRASCEKQQDAGGPLPDSGPAGDGAAGAKLSLTLKSNCLNWPATPFSPSNKTGWVTSVFKGQSAVEFTLKDTASNSYTLSKLLATRPVWLQLGSYT